MNLDIISPEKVLYSGNVELISLPGVKGLFTILERHAPIISALGSGTITYQYKGKEATIQINGGFVESNNNNITVCIE